MFTQLLDYKHLYVENLIMAVCITIIIMSDIHFSFANAAKDYHLFNERF